MTVLSHTRADHPVRPGIGFDQLERLHEKEKESALAQGIHPRPIAGMGALVTHYNGNALPAITNWHQPLTTS